MTPRQHAVGMAVAAASKRGEWFIPSTPGDKQVLGKLFRRGYFQRRRTDGAFRLFMLWPVDAQTRAEIAALHPDDRNRPHYWWPPYATPATPGPRQLRPPRRRR